MKQLVCNRPTTKECILFISVLDSFYSARYEVGASTSRWSRCIVQNVNQLLFQCGLRAKAAKKRERIFWLEFLRCMTAESAAAAWRVGSDPVGKIQWNCSTCQLNVSEVVAVWQTRGEIEGDCDC